MFSITCLSVCISNSGSGRKVWIKNQVVKMFSISKRATRQAMVIYGFDNSYKYINLRTAPQ